MACCIKMPKYYIWSNVQLQVKMEASASFTSFLFKVSRYKQFSCVSFKACVFVKSVISTLWKWKCRVLSKSFVVVRYSEDMVQFKARFLDLLDLNRTKANKCKHCDKTFSHGDSLKRHTLMHIGEKLNGHCKMKKSLNQAQYRNTHTHNNEKTEETSQDKPGDTREDDLKLHKKVHWGEEPHKCTLCKYFSKRFDNLQQHMRIHHMKSHWVELVQQSVNVWHEWYEWAHFIEMFLDIFIEMLWNWQMAKMATMIFVV